MPVAEKYRALRDFKFNERKFKRGDAISRDYILSTNPEKLGTLQRAKFIGLDPLTRPLDKMTKVELVEYGREVGADVDQRMTKAELREAIKGVL